MNEHVTGVACHIAAPRNPLQVNPQSNLMYIQVPPTGAPACEGDRPHRSKDDTG